MPTFEVKSPDGRKFRVTAPDGASQADILAYAQKNMPAAQAPARPGSFDVIGNIKERAGSAYDALKRDATDLGNPSHYDATIGDAASLVTSPLTGAYDALVKKPLASAMTDLPSPVGALTGDAHRHLRKPGAFMPPVPISRDEALKDNEEAVDEMMMTVGPKADAPAKAGSIISRLFGGGTPKSAAVAARTAGYVLPPGEVSDTTAAATKAAAGFSGKVKTAQSASAANQAVTNRLAAKALGLPDDTVFTDQVFKSVRDQASQAYQAVASAVPEITADGEFQQTIKALGGNSSQAAKHFPDLMKNPGVTSLIGDLGKVGSFPPQAGLEVVKELRFNATANLKAIGDPQKHALGLAQREAADAIDDLMERVISKQSQSADVIDKYRAARQMIAKSYDVEAVTNTATGDVSARGLAKLADKGKPLTGELKTVADVAAAFPKAVQDTEKFGGVEDLSVLDFAGSGAAALGGAAAVGPAGAAAGLAPLGRPLVRRAILSKPFQDTLVGGKAPAALPQPPASPPRLPAAAAPALSAPAGADLAHDDAPVGPRAAAVLGASPDF